MFIISSTFLNSGSHAIYITFMHSSRMQPASGEFKYALRNTKCTNGKKHWAARRAYVTVVARDE
jgi:hypothetical protein